MTAQTTVLQNVLPAHLAARQKLNLGCGRKQFEDAVNVDIVGDTKPDIVINLDRTPWPLPDSQFREVCAYDVIEHLDDVVATMEEIHRVCQPGALVHVTVPHYSCVNAFTDPTHRHYFSASSFNYFTGENEFSFYSKARFRMNKRMVIFYPSLSNRVVSRLSNRFVNTYEQRWAWVFPAWYLYFLLEVVK